MWLYRADPGEFPHDNVLEFLTAELDPDALHPVESVQAYTDRGRPVTYFSMTAGHFSQENAAAIEKQVVDAAREKVIRLGPPDATHNCHGWTFAGGRYWIKGRDVDVILADNGYRAVTDPRADDLAVFRDGNGMVNHSAVVRNVLPGGELLLESKWGWGGRFVHTTTGHVYGSGVTYYRSDRGSHRVRTSADPPEADPQHAS